MHKSEVLSLKFTFLPTDGIAVTENKSIMTKVINSQRLWGPHAECYRKTSPVLLMTSWHSLSRTRAKLYRVNLWMVLENVYWQPRHDLTEDSRTIDFRLALFVLVLIRMTSSRQLWNVRLELAILIKMSTNNPELMPALCSGGRHCI